MATKNLTRRFIDIRNAAKSSRLARGVSNDPDREELSDSELLTNSALNSSSSNWKGKDSASPVWIDKIEQAEGDLSRIQNKSNIIVEVLLFSSYCFIRSARAKCPSHKKANGQL